MICMASSRGVLSLRNVIGVVLILHLLVLPSKSGKGEEESLKLKVKMGLGSSPPKCVNKCLGCKPCMAALVINPPSKLTNGDKGSAIYVRDESYYLLSWKCKCRNKYFQP